jgi:hypothetical protein
LNKKRTARFEWFLSGVGAKVKANKKGQAQILGGLQGVFIALAIVAIVGVVAMLIISQGKTQIKNSLASSTVINKSVTFTNASYTKLGGGQILSQSCANVYNTSATDPKLIKSSNYTCNANGIIALGAYKKVGTAVNVTYTYTAADIGWNGTAVAQNSASQAVSWLPILVIVIIGALLVGLVMRLKSGDRL